MDDWVRVHDNGVRSFVPPSFSWDLINQATGQTVDTVSDFDLSRLDLDEAQTRQLLHEMTHGTRLVAGIVEVTEPIPPSGQRGKILIVTRAAAS